MGAVLFVDAGSAEGLDNAASSAGDFSSQPRRALFIYFAGRVLDRGKKGHRLQKRNRDHAGVLEE